MRGMRRSKRDFRRIIADCEIEHEIAGGFGFVSLGKAGQLWIRVLAIFYSMMAARRLVYGSHDEGSSYLLKHMAERSDVVNSVPAG